jgi:Ni,Fe-hydrogenase I cytochrome b subunit
MYKRVFFHALLSATLAAIAGIIYYRIYFFATEADFSKILNPLSITAMSIFVCMIASFIYIGLVKWLDRKGEIIFNFLFSIISFACVMLPISISLPLDIKFPELFPGLAVPMVFFPALAWMTARPLFARK